MRKLLSSTFLALTLMSCAPASDGPDAQINPAPQAAVQKTADPGHLDAAR